MEKFTLFYGGPFCQGHLAPVTIDEVQYNCAGQYVMAQKARLFKDYRAESLILCANDPAEQKALGRKVRRFKVEVWEAVARDIVMRANLAKFTSTIELYEVLMATQGTTLVEASPTDHIWGIALSETDPRALDRDEWCGRNWLGQVLTDLRDSLPWTY